MATPFKIALACASNLALASLAAAPASAYVQTGAELLIGGEDGIIYDYNTGPYTTNIGTYTSDTCNGRPGCTATGSGTVDASGTLTSSTDQVTLSVPVYGPNRFGTYAPPQSGSAAAHGSLATGTIGVLANGTFADLFGTGGQDGVGARGTALIADGLHFHVAGATGATVTDIGVTFSVHGSIGFNNSRVDPYFGMSSGLLFGSARFNSAATGDVPGAPPSYSFSDSANNWVSYSYSSNTADDIVFKGIYALTGATTDIGITEELDAGCGQGVDCDYSHTGAVTFSLPGDVTFTSDSGVFLTATIAPEPGSLLILSTGLALAATFGRRPRWRSPAR